MVKVVFVLECELELLRTMRLIKAVLDASFSQHEAVSITKHTWETMTTVGMLPMASTIARATVVCDKKWISSPSPPRSVERTDLTRRRAAADADDERVREQAAVDAVPGASSQRSPMRTRKVSSHTTAGDRARSGPCSSSPSSSSSCSASWKVPR